MSDRVLHRFRKNSSEDVQATLSEFKDTHYAIIRVYYEAEPGVWPPKKGPDDRAQLLPEPEKSVLALRKAAA